MMPESLLVQRIMAKLEQRYRADWYGIKVHGDQFTVNQPDIVGVYKGIMIVMECKRPGEEPRVGQAAILYKWQTAGAIVIAPATSVKQVLEVFESL